MTPNYEGKWTNTGKPAGNPDDGKDAYFWHDFDLLVIIKISIAVIFIYSVQYTLHT